MGNLRGVHGFSLGESLHGINGYGLQSYSGGHGYGHHSNGGGMGYGHHGHGGGHGHGNYLYILQIYEVSLFYNKNNHFRLLF